MVLPKLYYFIPRAECEARVKQRGILEKHTYLKILINWKSAENSLLKRIICDITFYKGKNHFQYDYFQLYTVSFMKRAHPF